MSDPRSRNDSRGFEDLGEELDKWDEMFDSLHEPDSESSEAATAEAEAPAIEVEEPDIEVEVAEAGAPAEAIESPAPVIEAPAPAFESSAPAFEVEDSDIEVEVAAAEEDSHEDAIDLQLGPSGAVTVEADGFDDSSEELASPFAPVPSDPAEAANALEASGAVSTDYPRIEAGPEEPEPTPTPTPSGVQLITDEPPIVAPPLVAPDPFEDDEVEISIVAEASDDAPPLAEPDAAAAEDPFTTGDFAPIALGSLFEASPPPRRGPAIVRRDDLNKKSFEDPMGPEADEAADEWDRPSITSVMAQATVNRMVDRAAAFFGDEDEPEVEFELDADFYDDIEIDAESSAAPAEPATPVPLESSGTARRTMAHVVRRARTESTRPPAPTPLQKIDTAVRLDVAGLEVGERLASSDALEAAHRAIDELALGEGDDLLPVEAREGESPFGLEMDDDAVESTLDSLVAALDGDFADDKPADEVSFDPSAITLDTSVQTLDTSVQTLDTAIPDQVPEPLEEAGIVLDSIEPDEPAEPLGRARPSPLEALNLDLPPQLPMPRLAFGGARDLKELSLSLPEDGGARSIDVDGQVAELKDAEDAIAALPAGPRRAAFHRWSASLALALGDIDGAEQHSAAAQLEDPATGGLPGHSRRVHARAGAWDQLIDEYVELGTEAGAVLAGELSVALGVSTEVTSQDGDAGALLRAATAHARAGDVPALAECARKLAPLVADQDLRRALAGLWLRATDGADRAEAIELAPSLSGDIVSWECNHAGETIDRAANALVLADAFEKRGDATLADGLRIVASRLCVLGSDDAGAAAALLAATARHAAHPAVSRPLLDLLDADAEAADYLIAVVSGSPAAPLAARALWRWSQNESGGSASEMLRRAHALSPDDALILEDLARARRQEHEEDGDEDVAVGLALAPAVGGDLVDSLNRARTAHLQGDAEGREKALAGVELPSERLLVVGERLAHIGRGAELGAPAVGIAHEVLWRHRALANIGSAQPAALAEDLLVAAGAGDRISARARMVGIDPLEAAASEKLWEAAGAWDDIGGRVELAQARLSAYLEPGDDAGLRLGEQGADLAFGVIDEWTDPRVKWLAPVAAARCGDWQRAADRMVPLAEGRFRSAYLLLERVEDPSAAEALLAELLAERPELEYVAELTGAARRKLGVLAPEATTMPESASRSVSEPFATALRAAEAKEAAGDFSGAIESYRRALEHHPGDPIVVRGIEWACANKRDAAAIAELALAELRAAEDAKDRAARADAYEVLARIDDEISGDTESAIIAWESAAECDPSRPEALRALERAYLAGERHRDLLIAYGRLLALTEDEADEAAVRMLRARVATLCERDAGEVAADYAEALELDPSARMALFFVEERARQAPPSAERAAIEEKVAGVLAADPRSAAAFLCRSGETLSELGETAKAIEKFRAALEVSAGHHPSLEGWRSAALKGEQWEEFAAACDVASESQSSDRERAALLHLGGVALMDRALDGANAVSAFERAIAVGYEGDDAFARLHVLFDETGDDERLGDLLKGRLAIETDPAARLGLHLELAKLCRNFWNDRTGATDQLRAALEIEPNNREAVADLSDISWELGAWEMAAESLLARAKLETNPNILKHIFYRLGTIYADHLPDPTWSIRCFKSVLSHDPGDLQALERLARLTRETGDFKTSLGAYERLLKLEPSTDEKVAHLHSVAEIQREVGQMAAAERAVRVAFDLAPGSRKALGVLLSFYREAGDVSSIRVNLDRAAQAMRARHAGNIEDTEALAIIARVLAVRERSGVAGSLAVATVVAEIAGYLGDESPELTEIAATRASSRPRLEALARNDLDELLVPSVIPFELRHILRAIRGRATKYVGADPKRFGVGRGDRQKRGKHPVATLAAEMAAELGLRGAEIYVSSAGLGAAIAVPTDPVSLVLGSRFASLDRAAELTFAVGRGLKLGQMGLALVDTMSSDDLDLFVAGIIRLFAPDYAGFGQTAAALDAEQHRLRRLLSNSLAAELRPHALALVNVGFQPGVLHAAMSQTGLRAGLLASTNAAGALAATLRLGGHSSIQEAKEDPAILGLLRFALSEEHVLLRAAIAEEANKSS